jgi:hypothetical protein
LFTRIRDKVRKLKHPEFPCSRTLTYVITDIPQK